MLAFLLVLLGLLGSVVGQATVPASTSTANDILILQYALTLENLEAQFYRYGLGNITQAQFATAGYNATTYSYLTMIRDHELAHVALLSSVIASLNTVPVPYCQYNFAAAFASPAAFIATAAALENAGQTAYDGALNGITNSVYAQTAAQIATVEARHAAYLNTLIGASPFPTAFDPTNNSSTILTAVTPFIVSCPYNPAVVLNITVRPGGVTLNAANQVVATGPVITGRTTAYTAAQRTNDLNVLQYALVLENLENAFYNFSQNTITLAAWTGAGLPAAAYSLIGTVGAQEQTHVTALTAVITARGGTPIPVCPYNFSAVTGPRAYLSIASVLEQTGVQAYDGAAAFITDTALQQIAATIATVEARHSSYLYQLLNSTSASNATGAPFSPFPSNLDIASTPAQIVAAVLATGFLGNCGTILQALSLPVQLSAVGVAGDPAFVGFHGQKFQVHGIPSRHFNLLSTPTLQVSSTFTYITEGESMTGGQQKAARLAAQIKQTKNKLFYSLPLTTAFSHEGTFLTEIGMKFNNNKVYVQSGSYTTGMKSVTLNGKDVSVSFEPLSLGNGFYLTRPTPSVLRLDTPELSFDLVNSDNFFNIESATLSHELSVDTMIDGLLGQTANKDWKIENTKEFKEHMVMDYLIQGDLFGDDFVANQFKSSNKA